MSLRFALLLVGIACIAAIYIWGMRRGSNRRRGSASRRLPVDRPRFPFLDKLSRQNRRTRFDDVEEEVGPNDHWEVIPRPARPADDPLMSVVDVPIIPPEPEPHIPDSLDEAEDTSQLSLVLDEESMPAGEFEEPEAFAAAAAEPVEEPEPRPAVEPLLVILNVLLPDGERIDGATLVQTLENTGLRFGDMDIFHHPGLDPDDVGLPVFSVANALEPGTFDLDALDEMATPGVTLFLQLPSSTDPDVAFELMLNTAQRIADRLDADVHDQARDLLTAEQIRQLRSSVRTHGRS